MVEVPRTERNETEPGEAKSSAPDAEAEEAAGDYYRAAGAKD